jgi:hypothetical protein
MAARFWVGGGSSTNWSATAPTNWSATSGGSNNATVPGASDDVTFNGVGGSANGTATITTITILSLTVTSGYTGTWAGSQTLTVAGNVTLGANMTISGTSALNCSATATLTSNGKIWPNAVTLSTASTKTFADDWTINGNLTITGNQILNGSTLHLGATLTLTNNITGTTIGIMEGTGTVSGGGSIFADFRINTSGTITLGTLVLAAGTSIKYIAGTVNHTGSLTLPTGTITFDTAGINWNNISSNSTPTLSLTSDLNVTGTLSATGASPGFTFTGAGNATIANLLSTTTSGVSWIFSHLRTYTITTSLVVIGRGNAANAKFSSSDATIKAAVTLSPGAICTCIADFTRIDASAGRGINAFNGTITDCNNIYSFTDALPPAIGRISTRPQSF